MPINIAPKSNNYEAMSRPATNQRAHTNVLSYIRLKTSIPVNRGRLPRNYSQQYPGDSEAEGINVYQVGIIEGID